MKRRVGNNFTAEGGASSDGKPSIAEAREDPSPKSSSSTYILSSQTEGSGSGRSGGGGSGGSSTSGGSSGAGGVDMGVKRSYERRNVLGRVFVLRDALRAVPRPSRSSCFAAIVIIAVLASLLLLWLYPGLATPFAVPVHFGQSNAYGRRQARRRQLVVKARAPKDSPRVERHPNWWLPKRDGTSAQIVNWRQWEALNQFDRHLSNATGTGAAVRALAHSMVDRHLFGATGRRVAFEHTQSRISSGMQPHFYAPPGFVGGEEKGSAGWPSRPGLSGGQGALFVDHPTSDYPPPARPRRVVRSERARQRLLRQEWVADRAAVARVVVLKLPRSGSTWFTELLNAKRVELEARLPRRCERRAWDQRLA